VAVATSQIDSGWISEYSLLTAQILDRSRRGGWEVSDIISLLGLLSNGPSVCLTEDRQRAMLDLPDS
jgi:hypothetical protein